MNHPAPPKRRPAPPTAFLASLADGKSLTGRVSPQGGAVAQSAAMRTSAIEVQPLAAPRSQPVEAAKAPVPAPAKSAAPEKTVAPKEAAEDDAAPAQPGSQRYRVQKGDSLYGISRRFSVPLGSLAKANSLSAPYSLKVAQVLVIPGQGQAHRVAKGETVYGIARSYGVEMSALVAENALAAPYSISPGQSLTIPNGTRAAKAAKSDTSAATQVALSTPTAPAAAADPAPAVRSAKTKIPPPPPLSGGKFLWPVEGKVVAAFGATSDGRRNDGINIIAPRGAPVRAVENGVVAYAGEELRGFGRLLLIKHGDGWVTAYAHNDTLLVARGDIVERGQAIAKVGSSGNVASPQLHFEVRKGSRAVDPRQLLQPSKIASAN